jgi:quinol monooxygenase YgiN
MGEPVTVIARLQAKKGQESKLRQELLRLLAPTRAESGCINYDLHESQDDPGLFAFYENWQSQYDLDAHFQSSHLNAARNVFPDLLERPAEITKWKRVG